MDRPESYALTSDPEVTTMVETARQSLLIIGAEEIQFCLRFLVSIAKGVLESTGDDILLGEDPHDGHYIEEAMSARDRGIERIALACGGFSPQDAFGSTAIAAFVALVPMRPSGGGWADASGPELRAAYKRVQDGAALDLARTVYELSGPSIPTEYALEVLNAA
jgi:hypothetical protein